MLQLNNGPKCRFSRRRAFKNARRLGRVVSLVFPQDRPAGEPSAAGPTARLAPGLPGSLRGGGARRVKRKRGAPRGPLLFKR